MQLLLELDDRSRTLAEIHRRLQQRFGPQDTFLLLDPVSQLMLSLIGGRTHGEISKSAFEDLLTRFVSWEAVRDAEVVEIQKTIGAVSFAEIKAPRLKAALEAITRTHGRLTLDRLSSLTIDEALVWLERLPGVGRKVAAATLNFSTLRKATLVIDTHHLRVLRRVGLISKCSKSGQAYESLMPVLPKDWCTSDFDEHHHLIKRLGQTLCVHSTPICQRCPVQSLCFTARAIRADRQQVPH